MKEVIFCEDCKYRGWLYGIEIAFCTRDGVYVDENDFCSRGEKCEGKRTDVANPLPVRLRAGAIVRRCKNEM